MRPIVLLGAAFFASACAPDADRGAPVALDDALRADLQMVENGHVSGLQVVSAVERPQLGAPEAAPAPAPRRAQTPQRRPAPVSAPVAGPAEQVVVAEAPVASAPVAEVADAPGESEAPVMAPRPRAPVLVTGPADGDFPGGRTGGGDIGAVIGVVIRGGTGGGHCPPRRRTGTVYGGPTGPIGRVGAGVSRDPGAGRGREGSSATPSVVRAPSGGVAVNDRAPRSTGGLGGVVRR